MSNFSIVQLIKCLIQNNIVMSSEGRPMLMDFGVSHILSTGDPMIYSLSAAPKGAVRWKAVELIYDGEEERTIPHTKESDVWAFGMVIYVRG